MGAAEIEGDLCRSRRYSAALPGLLTRQAADRLPSFDTAVERQDDVTR